MERYWQGLSSKSFGPDGRGYEMLACLLADPEFGVKGVRV